MDTPTAVVINVEDVRRERAVSLLALSTATGIPRSSLRRKLANPDTFTLAEFSAIAAVLDIPTESWWVA